MTALAFEVVGIPGAQGSKRGFAVRKGGTPTGRVTMVESSKKVRPWRQDVKAAAERAAAADGWARHDGPVSVRLTFRFPRPKSHYRTGARSHELRPNAPHYTTSRAHGDADKLCRSSLDALVAAGILADDALVVTLRVSKIYTGRDGSPPGASVLILTLDP